MISTRDAFAAIQGLLGARVALRLLAGAAGDPIVATSDLGLAPPGVAAIVPVLNERRRLGPCLEGLFLAPAALRQIVVVDGGSQDGTQALVRTYAARDPRVRLVEAGAAPAGWNGKAWNLACGLAASDPEVAWILTLDADVRPQPHLIASLLAHAATSYLDAFSAAPRLELSGAAEAALHPAFLATLVYRFGLPGNVARNAREVQANGQCFFAKRELLIRRGAFAAARASRCEDVSVARHLVRGGAQVGFFEGGALASVRMYESAADCWANWPRSLVLRDESTTALELVQAFAELALVQALPLVAVLATLTRRQSTRSFFFRLNLILALARFGVLAGTRRAYANPSPSYWLAVLLDVPAVVRLLDSCLTRTQQWRGRPLVPERPPL